jgi:hypothetical protein
MPKSREDRDDRDRDDDRSSRSSRGRDDDRGRGRDRDDDRDDRGSKRGGDYEYASRSSEENTKRAKQGSGRYDSIFNDTVVYFSAKVGENCVRIIPWLNKSMKNFEDLREKYGNHWGIDAMLHRKVGPDNGTYLCLEKHGDEPCPMCEAYNDGEEDFKRSDRILCWVIDRNDEKAGPKLWNMPLGSSKDIQAASQVKKTGEWLPIEHWEEGYDIYFIREGEKDRTRYKQFVLDLDPSPLSENAKRMDDWLDQVFEKALPNYLKVYEADHIEKVLSGKRRAKDDDDGERDDRRRDRDDDRGSSRRSRDRDDDSSERRRRPSRDDDDKGEAEFTRPARRRGRDADDDGKDDDKGEDGDSRASRGRREEKEDRGRDRGRSREEPSEDDSTTEKDDPPPRSRRSSRDDDDKDTEKVERHRSSKDTKDKDDDDGGADDDKEAAKENLKRVGRRGGR